MRGIESVIDVSSWLVVSDVIPEREDIALSCLFLLLENDKKKREFDDPLSRPVSMAGTQFFLSFSFLLFVLPHTQCNHFSTLLRD